MNEEILKLWHTTFLRHGATAILGRVPKFVTPIIAQACRLALVSLNPSFRSVQKLGRFEAFRRFLIRYPDFQYPQDIEWNTSRLRDGQIENHTGIIDAMALLHDECRGWYPWFDRPNRIATVLGVAVAEYTHLDIYLWLSADSREVGNLAKGYPEFAKAQEHLFLDRLSALKPQRIVVAYAGVAHSLLRILRSPKAQDLGVEVKTGFRGLGGKLLLEQAEVVLPGQVTAQVFKPIQKAIPQGRFGMSESEFSRIEDFFEAQA